MTNIILPCIALLAILAIPFQSLAKPNVLDDIKQYKEWMTVNYPDADRLSKGQLFYEAAKAVYFNQREPEALSLLSRLNDYGLDLTDYIGWIKGNSNDSYLSHNAPTLQAIASCAKSTLGEMDTNYSWCQYFYLVSEAYLRDVSADLDELIKHQQQVAKKQNSPAANMLLCILKFERANIERFMDNPATFDGIFSAEAMMLDSFDPSASSGGDFQLAWLYKVAADAFCNISQYDEAAMAAEKHPTPKRPKYTFDFNRPLVSAREYYQAALDIMENTYPMCHPAHIRVIDDFNNTSQKIFHIDDDNLEIAQYVYDFNSYYRPYGSLEQLISQVNLWVMKHSLGKDIEDAFKISMVKIRPSEIMRNSRT